MSGLVAGRTPYYGMKVTRRTFVAWAGATVPLVLIARKMDALAADWLAGDQATLRSLAEAILPSELGAEGADRVARDFQRWIENYRENAELVHGYGTSALEFTKPSPRAKWAAQLESLRIAGFNERPVEQRRATIENTLADQNVDRLPEVADAQLVALGLLAFYYGSSEANDLCHRARIGRETCRPLMSQRRAPLRTA